MSIFQTPAPTKAPKEGQAVGALTGRKDPPPTSDSGVSVRHVPNADSRTGR
jgi:hypothetical protein